jgi:hypothetical protein
MNELEEPKEAELMPVDEGQRGAATPDEEASFNWSDELAAKMARLPFKQREVICALVIARIQGYHPINFLSSDRSCRWCGANHQDRASREQHEAACPRRDGPPWEFVAVRQTFYRWLRQPLFAGCLEQAHDEATTYILKDALRDLKYACGVAAAELRRQVEQGQDEAARQRAAVAILDRAGVETAAKFEPPRQLMLWLEELRAA